MNRATLLQFDPSIISNASTIIIIGKRDTGKSTLVRDLLSYNKDIQSGNIIAPGDKSKYEDLPSSVLIHDTYNQDIINTIISHQEEKIKNTCEDMQLFNYEKSNLWSYLVIDNVMYDTSWIKDKGIQTIAHYNNLLKIKLIITMSYAITIPPEINIYFDYIFILKENISQNKQRLYEQYGGMYSSYEEFSRDLDTYTTDNHSCLVINNTIRSDKITDKVFWYQPTRII